MNAHILHHTHWDREWFLSYQYTREWVPHLIDQIEKLADADPDYCYLLDGQTLIIEDLLDVAPEYEKKLKKLLKNKNLIIGPYYCQPDWKIVGGESLIRNLIHGFNDTTKYTEFYPVAWLADTFGHPAQSPQIHNMFDIKYTYVWRGVPKLIPFFQWKGSDGSELSAIHLFTGYRNLYGVTHVPEIGLDRLFSQVTRVGRHYPIDNIPLFDGYDLEQDPENAIDFYKSYPQELDDQNITLEMSHPLKYAESAFKQLPEIPETIAGDLQSGKYAGVFTGVTSSRTYLKIANSDVENQIFNLLEPAATLAALQNDSYPSETIDSLTREMMKNQVHDCICGVSLDLVHDRMEYSFKDIYTKAQKQFEMSIDHILKSLKSGDYTFSSAGFSYNFLHPVKGKIYKIATKGVGLFPIKQQGDYYKPKEITDTLHWGNSHYTAKVQKDGTVAIDGKTLGFFSIEEDLGDAYTNETTSPPIRIKLTKAPLVIEQSEIHQVIKYQAEFEKNEVKINLDVSITFDQTPLIKWKIELDSVGKDFNVKINFKDIKHEKLFAGMQYDIVSRNYEDKDLLPKQIDEELQKVLMGQRELNVIENFPFHDFLLLENKSAVNVIMANGLRDYICRKNGKVEIMLRRSAEWMDRKNFRKMTNRSGDAGSEIYGISGRCERKVIHKIGFMQISNDENKHKEIYKWNHLFKNPPLVINNKHDGSLSELNYLKWELPITALYVNNDKVLLRTFNPSDSVIQFDREHQSTDPFGANKQMQSSINPKEIMTIRLEQILLTSPLIRGRNRKATEGVLKSNTKLKTDILNFPDYRVGESSSLPSQQAIEVMDQRIGELEKQIKEIEESLPNAAKHQKLQLQGDIFTLARSMYELKLSVYLARKMLKEGNSITHQSVHEYDENVAKLGKKLSDLRIKKRIYDYVATI